MMNTSIVAEVNNSMNHFETISGVFRTNIELVDYIQNYDSSTKKYEPEITRVINNFYESISDVSKDIVLINKYGTVITDGLGGKLESNYFYGSNFFLNSIASEEGIWSDVDTVENMDGNVLIYAIPVSVNGVNRAI